MVMALPSYLRPRSGRAAADMEASLGDQAAASPLVRRALAVPNAAWHFINETSVSYHLTRDPMLESSQMPEGKEWPGDWSVCADEVRSQLGRPRRAATDATILDAAVMLLDERGYAAMTVDDIAARAGVGKQTIYRRWPSKAAVVLEAFTWRTATEVAVPDTGSLRDDVRLLLRNAFAVLRSGRDQVVTSLMAEAQFSDHFARAFRELFVTRRRAVLADLLKRGMDRGQLDPNADVEFLADMIYGPMWYRLLSRHGPIDDAFADQLSEFVLNGIGAPDRRRSAQ